MEGLAGPDLEVFGDTLESPHYTTSLGARGGSPQEVKWNFNSRIVQHERLSLVGCVGPPIVVSNLMELHDGPAENQVFSLTSRAFVRYSLK